MQYLSCQKKNPYLFWNVIPVIAEILYKKWNKNQFVFDLSILLLYSLYIHQIRCYYQMLQIFRTTQPADK